MIVESNQPGGDNNIGIGVHAALETSAAYHCASCSEPLNLHPGVNGWVRVGFRHEAICDDCLRRHEPELVPTLGRCRAVFDRFGREAVLSMVKLADAVSQLPRDLVDRAFGERRAQ